MIKDVFPKKDESFDIWQANFMTIIVANVVAWALGSVTALQAAQTNWAAAWAVARIKTTRNTGQVTAKKEAREAYEALLRPFIQQYIMVNPLITNQDRDAMQIKPRETERTPIPAPTTLPEVSTVPLVGNRVNIFFRQQPDAQGVSRRGKPDGVQFCELALSTGMMPQSPDQCSGRALASRTPFTAEFDAMQAGQRAYFYARWVNPKGEGGPWSERMEVVIP